MIANFVSNLSRAVMAPRAERVAVLTATAATKTRAVLRLRSMPAGGMVVFFLISALCRVSFGVNPHFLRSCISI